MLWKKKTKTYAEMSGLVFAAYVAAIMGTGIGGLLLHNPFLWPALAPVAWLSHGFGGAISFLMAYWIGWKKEATPLHKVHCAYMKDAFVYGHVLPFALVVIDVAWFWYHDLPWKLLWYGNGKDYLIAKCVVLLAFAIWHAIYTVRGLIRFNNRKGF